MCEEVCDEPNIFDDEKTLVANVPSMAEAVDIASRPEDVAVLEERVKEWIKRVQEVSDAAAPRRPAPPSSHSRLLGP